MKISDKNSDSKLVEKLHQGDLDAFDVLFKRYGDRLYGFALQYLKSKEESEELVQETFLKIWENRKKIKKDLSFKSYLFTIAYHNICKLFRKKQIYLNYIEENKSSEHTSINLEEQLEYKAALEQVDKLIEALPKRQKEIFIKSRMEGKTTREIAEEMNLATGTVDNQISLALKFLRKNLLNTNFVLMLYYVIFLQ